MLLQRYLIAGLLLCLTCAEMMSEGETYSQKLIEMDRLQKDDQVFVKRRGTDEMVAQYFCDKGKCTTSYCEDCFKIQSGHLYLILLNISHLDRFDAFRNSEKEPFLQNFSLVEDVSSTSAATAVSDETHIRSIKPNEPLHNATVPEADTGEPLSIEAKVAIGIIGAIVALVIALVIADQAKAGRDAKTTKAFRYLLRMFHNRKPKKQEEDPGEMDGFVPNPNEV